MELSLPSVWKVKRFFAVRPHAAPALIAVLALLLALWDFNVTYWLSDRGRCVSYLHKGVPWVVCAAGVFIACMAWRYRQRWGTWAFATLALMFNPVVYGPTRWWADEHRLMLHLLAAGLFLIGGAFLREPAPPGTLPPQQQ